MEQAQTELELEKAKRENLVAAEKAKILSSSPEAFELEKMKLLAEIYGPAAKWFFIQPGVDISYFINGMLDDAIISAAQ